MARRLAGCIPQAWRGGKFRPRGLGGRVPNLSNFRVARHPTATQALIQPSDSRHHNGLYSIKEPVATPIAAGNWENHLEVVWRLIMTEGPQPYVKTLEDELDWNLLNQLYGVVSQVSSFCFEIKKFCVTTEFVVLTLLAKFTKDKVDHSLFVAGFVIPLCFWFLDAIGYYYQVKLRGSMESIRQRIGSRHTQQVYGASGGHVISVERTKRTGVSRVIDAAFNHSMWLYAFMVLIDLVVWGLFVKRSI